MLAHSGVAVTDASQVGEARRAASALASGLGFSVPDAGRVALLATEAATNLAKHAQSGRLWMRAVREVPGAAGIELLATDRGPGIRNVARCFEDGYSSVGTTGTGLGAIRRLASEFDLVSTPGRGTCLWIRVFPQGELEPSSGAFEFGWFGHALGGKSVSGDAVGFIEEAGRGLVMVADGLGHGPLAARAADAAVRVLYDESKQPLDVLFERVHRALRGTRGAAVAIAELLRAERELRYVGVGNISASITTSIGSRSLVSSNGTVGAEWVKPNIFTQAFTAQCTLVMHSDGLSSRWRPAEYAALWSHAPTLAAAVLCRDHERGSDDATVAVVRARGHR